MITIVQPNSKTKYLKMWCYINDVGWRMVQGRIPYETEDHRFRVAYRRANNMNYVLTLESKNPLTGKALKLEPTQHQTIMDECDIPIPEEKFLDYSAFWKSHAPRLQYEEIKSKLKKAKNNPLKTKEIVQPIIVKGLLKRYKKGERLSDLALEKIKDYI